MEKESLAEILAKKPEKKSPLKNLGEVFKGRPSKEWELDELAVAARSGMHGRDFVKNLSTTFFELFPKIKN